MLPSFHPRPPPPSFSLIPENEEDDTLATGSALKLMLMAAWDPDVIENVVIL